MSRESPTRYVDGTRSIRSAILGRSTDMEAPPVERKLVAILAADIQGV
jgi:hypothetical protein